MVGFGLLDSLLKFGQQFDGALNLALGAGAVRRWLLQLMERLLGNGGDLVQLFVERVERLLCLTE
jgi:hypothetical protein